MKFTAHPAKQPVDSFENPKFYAFSPDVVSRFADDISIAPQEDLEHDPPEERVNEIASRYIRITSEIYHKDSSIADEARALRMQEELLREAISFVALEGCELRAYAAVRVDNLQHQANRKLNEYSAKKCAEVSAARKKAILDAVMQPKQSMYAASKLFVNATSSLLPRRIKSDDTGII